MQHLFFAELLVQNVVDGLQPHLRDIQQPVGHGLPGELQALAVKLLLQTVQRRVHHELLCRNMRHSLRGSKAAGQQRGLLRRFQNVGFASLLFAVLALIGVVYVLTNPELRRFHL